MHHNLQPREYQKNIATSVSSENSIVALPTGLGKTVIALMVAENRLKLHPKGKILLLAPTKPLVFQHASFFTNNGIHCDVLTGEELPDSRSKMWDLSQIISATPQTVINDVRSNRVHLKDFILSVIFFLPPPISIRIKPNFRVLIFVTYPSLFDKISPLKFELPNKLL